MYMLSVDAEVLFAATVIVTAAVEVSVVPDSTELSFLHELTAKVTAVINPHCSYSNRN